MPAATAKEDLEMDMERIETAQGRVAGRKFPAIVTAVALALTVNAAFGMALSHASTSGQKIYNAWYNDAGNMYADASSVLRKHCARG